MASKGGSKVVTGIVAFLLGFLFAIIVEAGVIFGVGYYALNTDIDTLFGLVGIPNSDDENRQYINTDTEAGGVANALELYYSLVNMYGRINEVSIAEVETLFPALDGLTEQLYATVSAYLEIDEDEFEAQSFAELPTYLQNEVMNLRPGALMRNAGMTDLLDGNAIAGALLEGVEMQYVYENAADKENSAKYPVFYDEYVAVTGEGGTTVYQRVQAETDAELQVYPANLNPEWLTMTNKTNSEGKTVYRQYFYKTSQGSDDVYVVTKKGANGEYIYSIAINSDNTYSQTYGNTYQYATGNFYYAGEEKIEIDPVTIGSLTKDALAPLYFLPVTAVLGEDEMIEEIFGDTSVGELIDGNLSLSDKVDKLKLASFIDVKVDDPVLMYMGYRLSETVNNGDGTYGAVYAAGTAEQRAVTVYVNGNVVEKVVDSLSGEEIGGVTVGEISEVIGGVTDVLTIGDLMDVEPDNMIMSYLAYGISNVKAAIGESYAYTANYEKTDGSLGNAYVYVKNEGGKTVIDYVAKDTPDGERLSCTTVGGVSEMVDGIKITSIMKVEADNAIMAYLAYGLTDMVKVNESVYSGLVNGEAVTVNVGADGTITSVEKGDGTVVKGTSIEDISARLENITNDLALADVMQVKPTQFNPDGTVAQNNNIMTFIAFSVSDVSLDGGIYKGVYNIYNAAGEWENGYPCVMSINSEGYISQVNYDSDGDGVYESAGVKTKIEGISDQITKLTSTLRIRDIVEIDATNNLMVKLGGYRIDRVKDAIDEFLLADAIRIDADDSIMLYLGYGITDLTESAGEGYTHKGTYITIDGSSSYECFVTIDGNKFVEGYYMVGANRVAIEGTSLAEVDDRSGTLIDVVSIGDVIDVDVENKIMMYMAYGLTSIEKVSETGNNAVFSAKNGEQTVYVDAEKVSGVYCALGFYTDAACTVKANVAGTKIGDVGARLESITNDLTVGDVLDPGEDKLLNAIADKKLGELSTAVNDVGLDIFIDKVEPDDKILMYVTYGVSSVESVTGQIYSHVGVIKNGGSSVPVYIKTEIREGVTVVTGVYKDAACTQAVEATKVSGVSEKINGFTGELTLGEIISINAENKVLLLIKDSTIDDLDTTVRNVSIQRMYTDNIYETDAEGNAKVYAHGTAEFNATYLYYIDEACTELAGLNGKLTAIAAGETYYTHGKAMGVWSLLLSKNGSEVNYTLNDMDSMVETSTGNIKDGTLGDLQSAGIIDSSVDLSKTIRYFDPVGMTFVTYDKPLSQMKLSELIDLVISMAS